MVPCSVVFVLLDSDTIIPSRVRKSISWFDFLKATSVFKKRCGFQTVLEFSKILMTAKSLQFHPDWYTALYCRCIMVATRDEMYYGENVEQISVLNINGCLSTQKWSVLCTGTKLVIIFQISTTQYIFHFKKISLQSCPNWRPVIASSCQSTFGGAKNICYQQSPTTVGLGPFAYSYYKEVFFNVRS